MAEKVTKTIKVDAPAQTSKDTVVPNTKDVNVSNQAPQKDQATKPTQVEIATQAVQSSLLNMAVELTSVVQIAGLVKERLDDMVKVELENNYAKRQEMLRDALIGLTGSTDRQAGISLDSINETNNKRSQELVRLKAALQTLQGREGADPKQITALSDQISSIAEQNQLAKQVQEVLLTQTMIKGGQINTIGNTQIDATKLSQALKSIEVKLLDLTAANKVSRDKLKPSYQNDIKNSSSNKGPGSGPSAAPAA